MSDRENSEMEIEEAKETDPRRESTSMEEREGQDKDLRTSEADWRHKSDPRSSAEKRENATQMRHELGQSSEYPVRTGAGDCQYYLNGGCFFGRSCRYNHPPRNQMGDDTVQPSAYKVRLVTPRTRVGTTHRLHRLGQPAGTHRTSTRTDASEPRSMKPHRFQPNSIIFLA
ncbi:hypothetical protein DY000_02023163 [Brassica cretica]|uniref:C3H1-type domain-containing protein n=1 Tax=Brassica cretica TaxID=69181 RepID=A0ABQ7E682_BRACR|nr:hypothetical protein DY000_02023163 [Brassica cretica]